MTHDNGTDGQTDGQTDRQTDRQSATQYAAPSYREEGRIKNIKVSRLPLGSVDRLHCRIIMALIQLTSMSKMFKSNIWTYCGVSELPVL